MHGGMSHADFAAGHNDYLEPPEPEHDDTPDAPVQVCGSVDGGAFVTVNSDEGIMTIRLSRKDTLAFARALLDAVITHMDATPAADAAGR